MEYNKETNYKERIDIQDWLLDKKENKSKWIWV